jgi:hypothetical protein
MRRIVAGITTLEEHLETIRQKPEVYRPLSCPHCGIKHLRQHGYYYRKADRRVQRPSLNPVPICRYRCGGCRRTCSRLPECIAPRRWYHWSVQQHSCRIDSTAVLPNAVPTTDSLPCGVSAAGGAGSRIAGGLRVFICVRVFPNWVGRVNSVRSGAWCSPRSACRVPWRGWTRRSASHDRLIPERRQTVGAPPGRGPHTLCSCH